MTAREKRLERALLAMFLEAEEMAVTSYETCTYPGSVFDDAVWRDDGMRYRIARAARQCEVVS